MSLLSAVTSGRIESSRALAVSRRRCYSEKLPFKKPSFPIDPLLAEVLRVEHRSPETSSPKTHTKGEATAPNLKVNLPPLSEWRQHFQPSPSVQHRVSVRNPKTALAIAEAFVPVGSKDKVIIESFPGPGQLTRALMNLPKDRIKKLIVMEDCEPYLEYLKPLEAIDPRVKVVPIPGYDWDSYQTLHELELLNGVPNISWNGGVHPHLQFISHLPSNVTGEQLIAQLFRSIPDQQWLFQYGRVPLSFILSDYVWKRVSASVEDTVMRCKLSVIAEAVAHVEEAVPFRMLQPFGDHFHPAPSAWSYCVQDRKKNNRRVGNPFQAINVIPLEHQVIKKDMLDKWDYCLRRLFVLKATALKGALPSLAPGAQTLIKKIADPDLPESERLDIKTPVRKLSVHDWSILLKAFDEWSFAPEHLSISDMFITKEL